MYARGLRRRKAMFGEADVEQRMAAAGEFGAPLRLSGDRYEDLAGRVQEAVRALGTTASDPH